ncbi:hypothetical protein [Crateriforma spongiae]|uniref:hypothetical protein n=1 Tax=Crateriforma spongiae TaxID=2724528 RepID=UPI0039AEDD81
MRSLLVCGLLVALSVCPSVDASAQGLLRRIFQPRQSAVCTGPNCATPTFVTPAYSAPVVTSSAPVVISNPPVITPPVVFDAPAAEVRRVSTDPDLTVDETASSFRRSLIQATRKAARSGDITFADALKIRVALFSPAFCDAAEDLCVTQMAFSGQAEGVLPMTPDGVIERASIDWDGFASFLERIVPIILQLISLFGG